MTETNKSPTTSSPTNSEETSTSSFSVNNGKDSKDFVTYTIGDPSSEKKKRHFSTFITSCYDKTLGKIGGDWIFLTLLGVLMSAIALFVDCGIAISNKARSYLYGDLVSHPLLQYLGWIWLPLCLILLSTSFTRLLAPQAAGSGIPEMKTILVGIIPKKSFTYKALLAKIIGLTAALGTGLPLGKEGPFVHIASMTAILLTKVTTSFRGIYMNKARHKDMLSAACAVGVAMAFAAPIGGVLFSIEVTAVHFAVRNYWRGFFAAVCATMLNRFIAVWFYKQSTLTAIYLTPFGFDPPYNPEQILAFAFIGVICGFLGAFFVWVHRKYVTFKNNNSFMKGLTKRSVLIYPFLVTLLFTSLTFPMGLGMFVTGEISTSKQIMGMFANFSWSKENPSIYEYELISQWQTPYTTFLVNLPLYVIFTFLGTILASTIPVPAGIFIPVFKIGAAIGRLIGELMYLVFPPHIYPVMNIIPGGYSIVGAAALAGAVTHTVSSSVIAFELTGQMTFALPVMVAVFIANGIAHLLQPSIFDSIIVMKKLPYLPTISSTSTKAYDIYVEDFMVRNIKFIWYGITFENLQHILSENKKIKTFPIVDSADSMILIGSANRRELISLIEENIGPSKKMKKLPEWREAAERSLDEALNIDDLRTTRVQIRDTPDNKLAHVFDHERGNSEPPWRIDSSLEHRQEEQKRPNQLATVSEVDLRATSVTKSNSSTNLEVPLASKDIHSTRFFVTKVDNPRTELAADKEPRATAIEEFVLPETPSSTIGYGSLPRKGILKKTNSFTLDTYKSPRFSARYPYNTIHVEDVKGLKGPIGALLKAKTMLRVDSKSSHITFSGVNKDEFPVSQLLNKIKQLEKDFERDEMKKTVDFTNCKINPAPHQLVERSNLLQVHSIFSLLGLQHSYVTAIGRLIGVVGLKELREVIERVNSGEFAKRGRDIRKFSIGFLTIR